MGRSAAGGNARKRGRTRDLENNATPPVNPPNQGEANNNNN